MAIKMEWRLLALLPLIVFTSAIKVPVDNQDVNEPNEPANDTIHSETRPVYYESEEDESEEDESEEPAVDSYLIPPNPYNEEVLPDSIVTPASYLLPPSVDQHADYYYAPKESAAQSDWYPIAQTVTKDQTANLLPPRQQSAAIPIFMSDVNHSRPFQHYRVGKVLNVPLPSLKLEPPSEDAPNDYVISVPSDELELPAEEIDHTQSNRDPYLKFRVNLEHPKIASHLTPPKPYIRKLKNPTKLYPKKYPGPFAPVSIPIAQYAEDTSLETPKAKPIIYFKPSTGIESPTLIPIDEKKVYLYEQAEKKRKFKGESDSQQEQHVQPTDNYEFADDAPPTEQDVSETNFGYPQHNIYRPAPVRLRQRPAPPPPAPAPTKQNKVQAPPAPDDRTEFRMHGMKGPHSYQFGYDTGKGKNRQFRFEERDNDGLVHGHYGYMDKHGKMRVVNYRAHPELGFHAEPQAEPDEEPKQP